MLNAAISRNMVFQKGNDVLEREWIVGVIDDTRGWHW